MKATLQIDTRAFNVVLREIARNSSRDAADTINRRLMWVLIKAIRYTEKANAGQIAAILGRIGTALKYTKKGERLMKGKRAKGRMVLREDSFAARIINARRRDYAGPDYMLWGNALDEAARKMIAARMRSVGFIKSGWLWAIRTLAPFVKSGPKTSPDKEAKTFGRPKGFVLPAELNPRGVLEAIATNSALIGGGGRFQSRGAHNPLPIAEAGLQKALADEKTEMIKHLREAYTKAARQAGAIVQ